MAMDARVHKWSELAVDRPMDLLERRRVIGEKMMMSLVNLSKGCHIVTHSHENEQFAYVMSGSAEFGIGTYGDPTRRTVVVSAGEVIELPSNVPHSCDALEDTQILDLFCPVSEKTGIDHQGRAH